MTIRICLLLIINIFLLNSVYATESLSNQPAVREFIQEMVKKNHFDEKKLVALFNEVRLRPTVIQNIQQPLEKKPWYLYRLLFVTDKRVENGVIFWKKNQDVLNQAMEKFGVPPNIIVATIGIESKYGKETGHYRVIDALSSVAFSPSPRAAFFRRELKEFLLLAEERHLDPLSLKGSYAGAMGAAQFMPDSYRRYALSYSGQNKPDLYQNEHDVIMSIANYYHAHGWIPHQPIVNPIPHVLFSFNTKFTPIPSQHKSRLLSLENYFTREYWLTYHNFDVIKKYNASDLYAMAIFHLSEKITTRKIKSDAS